MNFFIPKACQFCLWVFCLWVPIFPWNVHRKKNHNHLAMVIATSTMILSVVHQSGTWWCGDAFLASQTRHAGLTDHTPWPYVALLAFFCLCCSAWGFLAFVECCRHKGFKLSSRDHESVVLPQSHQGQKTTQLFCQSGQIPFVTYFMVFLEGVDDVGIVKKLC